MEPRIHYLSHAKNRHWYWHLSTVYQTSFRHGLSAIETTSWTRTPSIRWH